MLHLAPPPPRSGRLERRATPLIFVALGLLGSACGGEGPPPPPNDIGPRDLAVDLGGDLGGDMGSLDDGGGDGGPDATTDGGMVECEVEGPDMLGSEAASVFQRLAITSRASDFAVVFRERRPTFDDLWVRVYRDTPGGVVAGTDYAITTNASGMSVASESRDPAVVATDTGFLAAWIDNREMGYELWSRVLDADGVPAAALQRLTTSDGAAASPSLARASDGSLLAGYSFDEVGDAALEWNVARINTSGALTTTWTRVSGNGEAASRGAVVRGATTGFLAGWLDDANNVRVRAVTTAGAATGTAVTHGRSDLLGLNPAVLVFARNDGFDALWGQAIDDTAMAVGVLRSALTSDATGREPGVASLNGGVVVAYRHTTTAGTQLALALLNSRAELVKTELLGTTTALGGPVSVAVNNEGIIRIAWAEIDAGTTTTYSQAIVCTGLPADL